MVNMKDVAERANVSTTTVSHVINGTRYVSEELTERVKRAMKELDYSPNALASSLRSGRTKIIGLVIPDIANQFFSEISRKIEDNGYDNGYSVILCNTNEDEDKEESYIDVLIGKQVDGIVFISAGQGMKNIEKAILSNIPFVIVDRDVREIDADVVLIDNFMGGQQATNYLISLGHRRIACITGPSAVSPSADRVRGYEKALSDANIPIREDLIVRGDFHYESGRAAMEKLLALDERPTAVFACNDMMATGAMQAIYNNDLEIPGDISIVGFDNIPFSSSVYPTLTTVAQPFEHLAKLIIDLLIEKMDFLSDKRKQEIEAIDYQRYVIGTDLIVRDSCGSPPA
jgi:LacI family transcriptional regulator